MDLVVFHRGLLGRDPDGTPELFRVFPQQCKFYESFPTTRGFSVLPTEPPQMTLFISTLVGALAQTRPRQPQPRTVHFFIPKHLHQWVLQSTQQVFQHVCRSRKGDVAALKLVRKMVSQLRIAWNFLQLTEEPPYWVAFGLHQQAPGLPTWIKNNLVI